MRKLFAPLLIAFLLVFASFAQTPPTYNVQSPTFTADILQYYAPPASATLVQLSPGQLQNPLDPNNLITEDRNFDLYNINVDNMKQFVIFQGRINLWKSSNFNGPMPTPPVYHRLNEAKFEAWCTWMAQNPGQDAPDLPTLEDTVSIAFPNITNVTIAVAQPPQQAITSPVGANVGPGLYAANVTLIQALGIPAGYAWPAPDGTTVYLYVFGNPFTSTQYRYLWETVKP